jgi:hypothetical protein
MEEVGREHDSSVVVVAVEDFSAAKVRLILFDCCSPLSLFVQSVGHDCCGHMPDLESPLFYAMISLICNGSSYH